MDENIIANFKELKVVGDRSVIKESKKATKDNALIEYLKQIIKNGEVVKFEDIGFCYWNISDNYALLRNGYKLYQNHMEFYNFIENADSKYLFWLVNDATQRFTLEKDGYSSFWWDLYRNAVNKNTENDTLAEFWAHRTALSVNPIVQYSKENLIFTINAVAKFLIKHSNNNDYNFYKTMFEILRSRYTKEVDLIVEISVPFLPKLKSQNEEKEILSGEWTKNITAISKQQQAKLILNSAINCLIYTGEIKSAKELYKKSLSNGLSENKYIETLLKLFNIR